MGNGREGMPLFQAVSRDESNLSVSARQRFMQGVQVAKGELGWRMLWLAKNDAGHIMGHIDIRPTRMTIVSIGCNWGWVSTSILDAKVWV